VGLYYPDMTPNHQEGFLIDDGEFRQLHVPGSVATQAWDMNPTGEIVGFYRTSANVFHGFVLREGDQYTPSTFRVRRQPASAVSTRAATLWAPTTTWVE